MQVKIKERGKRWQKEIVSAKKLSVMETGDNAACRRGQIKAGTRSHRDARFL